MPFDGLKGLMPSPTLSPFSPEDMFLPDVDELNRVLNEMPPDPVNPVRPRPSKEVLLQRKERMLRYWRGRNLRMMDDEKMYKLKMEVPRRLGQQDVGSAETLVMNDPYILCEKTANMLAATEMLVSVIPKDPGMKEIAQKVEDFLYWWREEADLRHFAALNNSLARDEVYYLALRGWLSGRIMLDPGDPDFPWRYDVVDPIHIYPQKGPKGLRWVYHIYKDSKINVLNDLGWDNDLLARIEERLQDKSDESDITIASFFDDIWHVLFLDDEEVWSAPHNYGFVPWVIATSFGPPIRRVDPQYSSSGSTDIRNTGMTWDKGSGGGEDYTRWWGVSVFEGIKEPYKQLNKLASAVMTEAMKAPNPPVVVFTNAQGEAEGKTIETGAGSTNYLIYQQEEFKVVDYGFKPSELAPLMQMLIDARNRGALPAVMYGEGANYLSGFAVSLLQAGSRDVILPLIESHQRYLTLLNRNVLTLLMELYPFPINMVETDPQTGARTQMTTITADDIRMVGTANKVKYPSVFPQDKQQMAAIAGMLVDKKLISLDTARGDNYLGLRNPSLENRKVLGDLAYFNPEVVQASIPSALLMTDPFQYLIWINAQIEKARKEAEAMQLALMTGGMAGAPGNMSKKPPVGPETAEAPSTMPPPGSTGPGGQQRPQGAERIEKPPY